MFSLVKPRELSEFIPFVGHIRDDTVLHTDGSITAFMWAAGLPWETADTDKIIRSFEDYKGTLSNINHDTITISTYQCRGMVDPSIYPTRKHPSSFANNLVTRYRATLFDKSLFNNQLYISVTISPNNYVGDLVGGQLKRFSKSAVDAPEDRVQRLDDACGLIKAKMAAYGIRRLGIISRGNAIFSEISEALVFAMTGVWRPIGLTTGKLSNAMFSERVIFGRETMEFRTPAWSSFGAMFGIKEYPASTWPGMFEALSRADYCNTVFQSFRFVSKATADKIMNRKQNFMVGAEDKAYEQREELRIAGNDLMSNKFVMGHHTFTVLAFSDTMKAMRGVATSAWNDVADSGIVVVREGPALQAAWLSMISGNHKLWPRPAYVSSRNFCAMAPLHNYPQGPEREHWGRAIAVFRGIAGTAYRFHWHVKGVGNTIVTGETGSGKSLLVGFLIAMTTGRARIFAFDYKRGWELLFRALNGRYSVLGDGKPNLSPLKALSKTPKTMRFLNDLIRGCVRQEFTSEESRRLDEALDTVMDMPPEYRSMGEVAAFLGTSATGAGSALLKWCNGYELGWVIDAPTDNIDMTGDLNGYDMTAIFDNARARGPALLTLFHYLELQIDGRPILIPNDEGWKALLDDTFRPMIETRVRTIRSMGGAFVFLTQGPDEIGKSDIGKTLVQQCPTQIRLPVDRAKKQDYVDILESTEGEWDAFKVLRKGSGMFMIVQGGNASVVELPLDGMEDEIATLSANQETLTAMDMVLSDTQTQAMLTEVYRQRRILADKREEVDA